MSLRLFTARRLTLVVALALVLSALGYGVGFAMRSADAPTRASETPARADRPSVAPSPAPVPVTVREPLTRLPEPTREPRPEPAPEPEPTLQPGPRLLGPGDEGDQVKDLQARLRQIDWFDADVTGYYGDVTEAAVRGFQAKREIPVTGEVDQRTTDRLAAMTTAPTTAELTNQVTSGGNTPGTLDARCLTGRVLCIDKTSRTLRWVVDGAVVRTVDVRFGGASTPTREGLFHVTYKDSDHVSSLYESEMPFSMFFSGGQAVHYSSDFAAVGYSGASHGCVNVRDYDAVAWVYDQVSVGDPVVVYWS